MSLLDILIDNAVLVSAEQALQLDFGEFDDVIAVKLKGSTALARLTSGVMISQGGGEVVNVTSLAGKLGFAHRADSMTKAAQATFTRKLAT